MNILIAKLGATGDVVRTTPLLEKFDAQVTWITAAKNISLLEGLGPKLRPLSWEDRDQAPDIEYDLIINLEDTDDVGGWLKSMSARQRFGAYLDDQAQLRYTDDSKGWFDLSLISVYGRKQADLLKLRNRRTYQDLIFEGLGFRFNGGKYRLPEPTETGLTGDVAIAAEAGPVWPMKNWAYYEPLKRELENRGLVVNYLPKRPTLLEHLCDVRNHRCLVGGDSLPMHFALGTGVRCVTLFNCTSPWEIYEYGLLRKIISPLLEQFFYQRDRDERATTAITLEEVLAVTLEQLALCPQKSANRCVDK